MPRGNAGLGAGLKAVRGLTDPGRHESWRKAELAAKFCPDGGELVAEAFRGG